jgi:hypothetical protein
VNGRNENTRRQKLIVDFTAIASALFGFYVCLWSFGVWWYEYVERHISTLLITWVGALIGLIVLAFLARRIKSKICNAIAVLLAAVHLANIFFPVFLNVRRDAKVVQCTVRLGQVGKAMVAYSEKNGGRFPAVDEWCTLLLQESQDLAEELFKCPGAKRGDCSYAINPNVGPNSPPDMVLLFESRGGWNEFGGAEIVSFKNHRGRGCTVLFKDGSVRFIRTEEFGDLRWR